VTAGSGSTPRGRWETSTAVPLLCLGLVFLAAFAIEVLWASAPPWVGDALRGVQVVIWVLFLTDYAVRFSLSTTRWEFVRRSWIDLAAVLLPFLRPLSPLALLGVVHRAGRTRARRSAVVYAGGTTLLLFTVCSLGVLKAERGQPGANIITLGDATWWAAVTVATVGYGDRYPVTLEGRLIALALMATGVALLGLVIANVAAWFIERFGLEELSDEQQQLGLSDQPDRPPSSSPASSQRYPGHEGHEGHEGLAVAALVAEVAELRVELVRLRGLLHDGPPPGGPPAGIPLPEERAKDEAGAVSD
jgi:voltage-gated potassium channel